MVRNRIGMLRREAGLNQKELGQRLGVGQTTVSAWETGKNEPDSESLHKMAQFFHVSIGFLAGYEEPSLTRGLSREEHDGLVEQALEKRWQKKHERNIERQESGMDEEEIEEFIRYQEMEEWENSEKAETFEGYLASRLIDQKPAKVRSWLLDMLRLAANHPSNEEK